MGESFDFESAMWRLPPPTLDDLLRARREAEQEPPLVTTIAAPDFPKPFSGTTRFPCPLECGWHHDVHPGLEPMGPLLLPADFTAADLSAAISSQAEVRANSFRLRVEQAIADHFTEAHPER